VAIRASFHKSINYGPLMIQLAAFSAANKKNENRERWF
jgi:hypothetical protein